MPSSARVPAPVVLTPIQRVGPYWLKRDDLWRGKAPAQGGKSRTIDLICRRAKALGIEEICIALDRNSSVPGMVSRVCQYHGVKLSIWLPGANVALTPSFVEAEQNGATLIEVRPGYMSVRRKRLRDHIEASNGLALELGVGLLWKDLGVAETAEQTDNVRALFDKGDVKRVVVPVGSGGMLRGIAQGLQNSRGLHNNDVPILGVCCGNPPEFDLPDTVELVRSGLGFSDSVDAAIGEVSLDPAYEAKCLKFMHEGDLLWIVAHRSTE